MQLPNKEKNQNIQKCISTCKHLMQTPSNKWRCKKNFKKEYLRRAIKLLDTKLHGRNLIKRINSWDVSFLRCCGHS